MNEADGGGNLLAPLHDIDVNDGPPPGYDVPAAMRRAGTIRRRRMVAGGIAALVAVAIAVPVALHQPPRRLSAAALPVADCSVASIPVPAVAGPYTVVTGIAADPTGRYVALTLGDPANNGERPFHVVLVDRVAGTARWVPTEDGYGAAVNAAGVVAGMSTSDSNVSAWVFRNGQLTDLPVLNYMDMTVTGINARGDIVGDAHSEIDRGLGTDNTLQSSQDSEPTAVIWPVDAPGTVRTLGPAGVSATSIADNGTVAGARETYGSQLTDPMVWPTGGTGHPLATGDNDPSGTVAGIAGDYAVGSVHATSPRPVVWNLATGEIQYYPPAVTLTSVTSGGVAVGYAAGPVGPVPVLARDGNASQLAVPDGMSRTVAVAVTADGRTVFGAGTAAGGTDGALIWSC